MTERPAGDPDPSDPNWDENTTRIHPFRVVPLHPTKVEPCLVVVAGKHKGQVLRLQSEKVNIGRAKDSDLPISDTSMSRHHATVFFEDGSCHVRDLGSTNGTFVNNRRVQQAEVTDGDRIQFGRHTIVRVEYKRGEADDQGLVEGQTRDSLTGAFNERYLEEHLHAEFGLAIRHDEELSLLVVRIDNLTDILAEHGDAAGDRIVRKVALLLLSRARQDDIIARYGGNDLVMVLQRTPSGGATSLAVSISALVRKTQFEYNHKQLDVTVSVGDATLSHPPQLADAMELLAAAYARLATPRG